VIGKPDAFFPQRSENIHIDIDPSSIRSG